MPISNYFQTLQTAAEAYFYLGWSVIPLLGDGDASRPKVPSISWAGFQECRASLQEQQRWFAAERFAGLGIVTGRISQLVVLDFDSETIFNTFKAQYPDLLETHTVRSAKRQLPHLYFHLPQHLHLASHKGQGIDLLSDGHYVVAPPTCIAGTAYKISRGGMPKTLTAYDIRRIQTFLKTQPALSVTDNSEPECNLTADDLQNVYHRLLTTHGRNDALFRTSLFARDRGQTVEQTENALVTLHSQQKGSRDHPPETVRQRQREALKTIQSAFSRPPRPLKPQVHHQQGDVSNSVREALMQQKKTYVLRTLEGLLQSGMHPGQQFPTEEAVTRLKGLVGRDSVLKALKAGEGENQFFAVVTKSKNTENAVSQKTAKRRSKKCVLIAGKNQEKSQGGRPPHLYRLPTNKEMCRMLGVKMTRSDALERGDFSSARQTRMALYRELIKRRSGKYSKYWLASRLGICQRTIHTYTKLLPIHTQAMFIETAVHWKTIDRLPLDEPLRGAFLQTSHGKKYPALRQIACRLLANREVVYLKQQTVNFYWYAEDDLAF